LVFPIISLLAQEKTKEDQTVTVETQQRDSQNKSENTAETKNKDTRDKHSIRFNFGAGYGYYSPADTRILKVAELYGSAYRQSPDEPKSMNIPLSGETSFNNPVLRYGLEYRYDDRFRFSIKANSMYTENLKKPSKTEYYKLGVDSSLQNPMLSQGKRDYSINEQTLARLAYYHPVKSWLRPGIILQREKLKTESGSFTKYYYTYWTDKNLYSQPNAMAYGMTHNLEGTTPGVGIELEPVDWFLISYGLEKLNLKGNVYSGYGGVNRNLESASNQRYFFMDLAFGNSELNGYRHSLDLEFRPFQWLSLHVGHTHETHTLSHGLVSGIRIATLEGINNIGFILDPTISFQKFNGRKDETYIDLEFVIHI
jgi:hypothetical protein